MKIKDILLAPTDPKGSVNDQFQMAANGTLLPFDRACSRWRLPELSCHTNLQADAQVLAES